MHRNFTHSYKHPRFVTMITSTFSHINPMHFGLNMYVLNSVASPLAILMGTDMFITYFLSATVSSIAFSHAMRTCMAIITKNPSLLAVRCIGISGVVTSILSFVTIVLPDTNVYVTFFPIIEIPIKNCVITMITLDILGIICGLKTVEHFGHLGGYLYGFLFYKIHKGWTLIHKYITESINQRKNSN